MLKEEQRIINIWLTNSIAKLSALTIFLMIVLVSTIYYAGQVIDKEIIEQQRIINLHNAVLSLSATTEKLQNQHEQFFLTKDKKESDSYYQLSDQTLRLVADIQYKDTSEHFKNLLDKISELLQKHAQDFTVASQSQTQLGLTLDDGLLGAMRKNVHEIEELMKKCVHDEHLKNHLLQIRRHEKDYLLKKEFRDELPMSVLVNDYKVNLNKLKMDNNVKAKLLVLITQYAEQYNDVTKSTENIDEKLNELKNTYLDIGITVYNLIDYSRGKSSDLQEEIKQDLYQWKMIIGTMAFAFLIIIGLYGLSILRTLARMK